jgi:phage baseplate assembly protein W
MTLGTDFSGGKDLDPALREVGGQRALADALIRRLTTGLGNLQDYPDYGFDISNLIGTSLTDDQIKQSVLAQMYGEEEVELAVVTVQRDGPAVTLIIRIVSGDGPFDLTLNINDVGVSAIIPPGL